MKYIGSKAKFASEIVPILQEYINKYNIKHYVEPFVGGFNVIDKIQCENKLGNDIDPLVCELVETCRERPELLSLLDTPSKEHYYDVRDKGEKYAAWYRAAILLFGSYNSRVYGGCYGATAKTKDGNIRNYFNEALKNFMRQLPNLKGILISNADYKTLRFPQNEKVLIYCDQPYSEGIGYKNKFDTAEFWKWAERQATNGHIVIVSEYTAPENFVVIWEHETITHLNNRNKNNRIEKLFIYGGNK